MKKMPRFFFVAGCILLLSSPPVYAGRTPRVEDNLKVVDSTRVQLLVTKDGSMVFGRLTRIVADYIWFESDGDTAVFFIPDIKEFKEISPSHVRNGRYWFPNSNSTRLYLFPTARPLEKGEGYVAGYYIIAPMFAYGLTSNLSIAGGATFLTAVNTAGAYLLPKAAIAIKDYFSISVGGALAQGLSQEEFNPTLFAVYSAATLGKPDLSATLGFGYGIFRLYIDGAEEMSRFSGTLGFVAGGEARIARRISLVTENYFIKDWRNYKPIVSYGMRFFGESFSLEGAFINTIGEGDFAGKFPGFPFIGIVYNF